MTRKVVIIFFSKYHWKLPMSHLTSHVKGFKFIYFWIWNGDLIWSRGLFLGLLVLYIRLGLLDYNWVLISWPPELISYGLDLNISLERAFLGFCDFKLCQLKAHLLSEWNRCILAIKKMFLHLDYPQLAPAAINHSIIVTGMVTRWFVELEHGLGQIYWARLED